MTTHRPRPVRPVAASAPAFRRGAVRILGVAFAVQGGVQALVGLRDGVVSHGGRGISRDGDLVFSAGGRGADRRRREAPSSSGAPRRRSYLRWLLGASGLGRGAGAGEAPARERREGGGHGELIKEKKKKKKDESGEALALVGDR